MVVNDDCPIGAVEKALTLASEIRIRDIPLDFDPGDLHWKGILATVARQYSNHASLLERLERHLTQAWTDLNDECDCADAVNGEDRCADCGERRLAEHRLWEAALNASEKACQRWLARRAMRRAAQQNT